MDVVTRQSAGKGVSDFGADDGCSKVGCFEVKAWEFLYVPKLGMSRLPVRQRLLFVAAFLALF